MASEKIVRCRESRACIQDDPIDFVHIHDYPFLKGGHDFRYLVFNVLVVVPVMRLVFVLESGIGRSLLGLIKRPSGVAFLGSTFRAAPSFRATIAARKGGLACQTLRSFTKSAMKPLSP